MKWRLISVSLVAFSAPAYAQSNVTLYGLLDNGLTYVSNTRGSQLVQMQDSVMQQSRFGFRGREDLGGGTMTIFQLENGPNLNTGGTYQPGLIFGRQAYVGLSNGQLGTLTLGRQYEFSWDFVSYLSSGSLVGSYGFQPGDYNRIAGSLRINNSVKYVSPTLYGITIGALYGFSGSSTAGGNGRVYALGLKYINGPFSAAVAYNNQHSVALTPLASIGVQIFEGEPASYFAENVSVLNGAASYTIGAWSLRIFGSNVHFNSFGQSANMYTYDGSAIFQARPDLNISAGVSNTKLSDARWLTMLLCADYWLSKRSDLYASVTYSHGSGGAPAEFLSVGPSTTENAIALRVGIRTLF